MKHTVIRKGKKENRKGRNRNNLLIKTLFIRLAISSILLAAMLILSPDSKTELIVLVISALLAGCDLFSNALEDIQSRNYFSYSFLLIIAGIICFILSYRIEAVVMLILYRIGMFLINYTTEKTKQSAIELIDSEDADIVSYTEDVLKDDSNLELSFIKTVYSSSGIILKGIIVVGILYSILLPLLAHYNVNVAIHRGLSIILVSCPFSLIAGVKACSAVGLGLSASRGSIFSNASALEDISNSKVAIFNKNKLFIDEIPTILSVNSKIVDEDTFLNLVSHLVYNSELDFCKAIVSAHRYRYQPNLVTEMKDINEYGVIGKINGTEVIFGTLDFMLEKGIDPDFDSLIDGDYYYLAVSGKYAGNIVLSRSYSLAAEDIINGLKERGVTRNILLSSYSVELTSSFASNNGFDEYRAEHMPEVIEEDVREICERGRYKKLYIFSEKPTGHSYADIDIKVGIIPENEDVLVIPEYIDLLPTTIDISRRMGMVVKENALFVFIIKAILVFLAMIGFSNAWFAVFMDFAAALATILHAIRITSSPIANLNFLNRIK